MKRTLAIFILCLVLWAPLYARVGKEASGAITFFGVQKNQIQADSLTAESIRKATETVRRLGRFLPEDENRVRAAMEKIQGDDPASRFDAVARNIELDLYVVIDTYRRGKFYYGEARIVPLDPAYAYLKQTIVVRSALAVNIPSRIAREIVRSHEKIPLHFSVLQKIGEHRYRISAGQWHGLRTGKTLFADGNSADVTSLYRYESIIETAQPLTRENGIITLYPDIKRHLHDLDDEIISSTCVSYHVANALPRGVDADKKFVESILFMNLGSNLILPVYGTVLTTGYLGLQQKDVSVPGIVMTSVLLVSHFLVPEIIGNFNVSFWPWERDANKSPGLQNLQIFLWASLPLLYTAGFLDQLAWQFSEYSHLPPFFEKRNVAALAFSTLFPGGGLFYKGYRILGWTFYLAEMSLLGYALYSLGMQEANYIFLALGILKAVDIITAAFIPAGFTFFNQELDNSGKAKFYPDIRIGLLEKRELITGFSAALRF